MSSHLTHVIFILLPGHRFDDPSAYRRPKVRARSSVASIIHVSDKDEVKVKTKAERQLPIMKKSYDHTPHEVSSTLPTPVELTVFP